MPYSTQREVETEMLSGNITIGQGLEAIQALRSADCSMFHHERCTGEFITSATSCGCLCHEGE